MGEGKKVFSSPYLNKGSYGPPVFFLQCLLKMRDCNGRNIEVDGDYGEQTAKGVEELQRQLGVSVDGNFGPETRAELLAQFGLDVNRLVLPNHFEGGVFAGGTSIVGPDGTKRFR